MRGRAGRGRFRTVPYGDSHAGAARLTSRPVVVGVREVGGEVPVGRVSGPRTNMRCTRSAHVEAQQFPVTCTQCGAGEAWTELRTQSTRVLRAVRLWQIIEHHAGRAHG